MSLTFVRRSKTGVIPSGARLVLAGGADTEGPWVAPLDELLRYLNKGTEEDDRQERERKRIQAEVLERELRRVRGCDWILVLGGVTDALFCGFAMNLYQQPLFSPVVLRGTAFVAFVSAVIAFVIGRKRWTVTLLSFFWLPRVVAYGIRFYLTPYEVRNFDLVFPVASKARQISLFIKVVLFVAWTLVAVPALGKKLKHSVNS